ncbi:hypothetical protein [Acinetobacter guillouiae]|uniref:hypothetical protein n=1 Tax=Acinetobacter guillouiae TaxID=106649 RepID=UPI00333F4AC6
MKFKKEIFQILIAVLIVAGLFTSFSWICIHYQNPSDSAKETLSIAVSFMGVLATIFAALIAVLLFNDWREQHNKQVSNSIGLKNLETFNEFEKKILELRSYMSDFENILDDYQYFVEFTDLYTDGNITSYQKILSKKNEIDISFHVLLINIKNYITITESNPLKNKADSYLQDFVNANKYDLSIDSPRDFLNKTETQVNGYNELKDLIKYELIEPLIRNLKVN